MKTTFVAVAPDGTRITRKSNTAYTHAMVAENVNGVYAASFHTSRALAERAAENYRKVNMRWTGKPGAASVVAVEVA